MAEDNLKGIGECPDCASQNIVHGTMRDQIICRDCGLIFEPLAPAGPVRRPARTAAGRQAAKAAIKVRPAKAKQRKSRLHKPGPKKAKPRKAKKPVRKKKKKWLLW
jgi:transcription initiation factor TFIIIB Brf1 subunit/transcription initiation factor TFIIB